MTIANKWDDNNNVWYIDSGASSHMIPHEFQLKQKKKQKSSQNNEITPANNSRLQIMGMSDTRIKTNESTVGVSDILYVPPLAVNLLFVYNIVCKGNKIIFDKNACTIYNERNEIIMTCKPTNGIYKFNDEPEKCLLTKSIENKALLWHRRLGHINFQNLCKMRDGAVQGIDFIDDATNSKM